jgi:UDP-3-O-[3-hydroxymyristoyl] glucosamine N-acyltransferase
MFVSDHHLEEAEGRSPPTRLPVRPATLGEIARSLEAKLEGDPGLMITGVAGLEDARPGDLVRVEGPRWLALAQGSPAAALIVARDLPGVHRPALRVSDPALAFARATELLYPPLPVSPGVHATAVIDPGVELGEGCAVREHAVIGAGARLGRGVVVHAHVVIGEGVEVGDETMLFPHVTLYPYVSVGRRVRIHAGSVIGADGFGYLMSAQGHRKRPHVGSVVIEDDVEIGANTSIDRATTGVTRIGAGTKIDNLVQIGHNCQLGRHCVIAAMSGLAGTVRAGDFVAMGGFTGVRDNVRLESGVTVTGFSGVWGDIRSPGLHSGTPARPHRAHLQVQAALQRLPALVRLVSDLARRVARLESRSKDADVTE